MTTTMPEAQVSEIRDRVTRIETRQLQMMEHLGMETQGRKPRWLVENDQGIIDLPSLGCSIKDILAAIPERLPLIVVTRSILVMFKGQVVTSLYLTNVMNYPGLPFVP